MYITRTNMPKDYDISVFTDMSGKKTMKVESRKSKGTLRQTRQRSQRNKFYDNKLVLNREQKHVFVLLFHFNFFCDAEFFHFGLEGIGDHTEPVGCPLLSAYFPICFFKDR